MTINGMVGAFYFNGVPSSNFKLVCKTIKRPLLPASKVSRVSLPGMSGVYDFENAEYDLRQITIRITYLGTDFLDLRSKARDIAAWLSTSTWGNLVINDEPYKFYKAKVTAETDLESLFEAGQADITFDCQPFAYSSTESRETFENVSESRILSNSNYCKYPSFELDSNNDGIPDGYEFSSVGLHEEQITSHVMSAGRNGGRAWHIGYVGALLVEEYSHSITITTATDEGSFAGGEHAVFSFYAHGTLVNAVCMIGISAMNSSHQQVGVGWNRSLELTSAYVRTSMNLGALPTNTSYLVFEMDILISDEPVTVNILLDDMMISKSSQLTTYGDGSTLHWLWTGPENASASLYYLPGTELTFSNPGTRTLDYKSPPGSKSLITILGSWTVLSLELNGKILEFDVGSDNQTLVIDNIEMEAAIDGANSFAYLNGNIDSFLPIIPGTNVLVVNGVDVNLTSLVVNFIPMWI